MKKQLKIVLCICAAGFLLSSCEEKMGNGETDSPTSGTVKFISDEGLTTVINNHIYTFCQLYKRAEITCVFSDEKTAIESLYNDSCKVICISRQLSENEVKKFASANLTAHTSCIGQTAVVLLVNKDFKDSIFSMVRLKALLKADTGTIKIMFDNQNSGCTRYLNDSILEGKGFGKNCFAAKNTKELFEKINSSNTTIGILDFSWLSDQDNIEAQKILKTTRLLPLSKNENETAYYPDQSNIKTGSYPMPRWIYVIRRGNNFSLSAGIETFMAGEKGQLMLLKAGLVPFRQEERLIQINTSPLGQ
jgi:phosphate transport system substrate-binding protein